MLPCEYKRPNGTPAENQLVFDLAAAQGQLQALGVTDRLVYGLACSGGQIEVKWSQWKDKFVSHVCPPCVASSHARLSGFSYT